MSNLTYINSETASKIKSEALGLEGFCQCCLSENNLRSMLQSYECNGGVEVYIEMINSCFSIAVRSSYEIFL